MCIYCGTNKYRKIYENHFGAIPRDEEGRSYDIHHADGNKNNNALENLQCVPLQEHYDIHYRQGDWGACLLLADRLQLDHLVKSELSRKNALHRVKEGTHHFLDSELQKRINRDRIENGTHHFLGETNPMKRAAAKGNHHQMKRADGSSPASDRVKNGSHHFLGGHHQRKQVERGKHPSQLNKICEYCGKTVNSMMYGRWHGDKCSSKIL